MDIAVQSVVMSQASLAQQVSISVMKKAMDAAKANGEAMTRMMESSVTPNLGRNIDIRI